MTPHIGDRRPHPALPITAENRSGVLTVAGCAATTLAQRFGTPLYVYDLHTVRAGIAAVRHGLGEGGSVHYAGKAYLATWLLRLVQELELSLDVSSESELRLALHAGVPAARIRLHGNMKRPSALHLAVQSALGAVVVDSLPELEQLGAVAAEHGMPARVLLRLNPGIEAHTHRYLQTGTLNSKFGIPIEGGDALRAVQAALSRRTDIELLGYHAHIGTQILDQLPYRLLLRRLLAFAEEVSAATGYWPAQLSPGGGPGITYTDEPPLDLTSWARALREEVQVVPAARRPHLSVEPGRAIIGPAGVALYCVGAIKRLPGGRTFVSVDGGMADNIRPALYQATYAAIAATRLGKPPAMTAHLVGPYCESGDILVEDALLPDSLAVGDLIALPAAGAYCLAMSSNYNAALRPAVVLVDNGSARLVQRRQRVEDLLALDVESDPQLL